MGLKSSKNKKIITKTKLLIMGVVIVLGGISNVYNPSPMDGAKNPNFTPPTVEISDKNMDTVQRSKMTQEVLDLVNNQSNEKMRNQEIEKVLKVYKDNVKVAKVQADALKKNPNVNVEKVNKIFENSKKVSVQSSVVSLSRALSNISTLNQDEILNISKTFLKTEKFNNITLLKISLEIENMEYLKTLNLDHYEVMTDYYATFNTQDTLKEKTAASLNAVNTYLKIYNISTIEDISELPMLMKENKISVKVGVMDKIIQKVEKGEMISGNTLPMLTLQMTTHNMGKKYTEHKKSDTRSVQRQNI